MNGAIGALEKAVGEELIAMRNGNTDVEGADA